MRTKITSMKRAFILFWHGLTALLVGIANWFTVILGMTPSMARFSVEQWAAALRS